MPIALPKVDGFIPALYRGSIIPEDRPASGTLGHLDCHFGVNGLITSCLPDPGDDSIRGFGPRAIDLKARGGIVAETLWDEWDGGRCTDPSSDLREFLITFDEVGKAKAPRRFQYPADAKVGGKDVSGHEKYRAGSTNKMFGSMSDGVEDGPRFQWGTRWSKVALELTLKRGGRVHFHLDGMVDLDHILTKTGNHNFSVTSRELRYVKRNWDRFENSTTFYNGYANDDGAYRAVIVKTPWN